MNRILYQGKGHLFHLDGEYRWNFVNGVPTCHVSFAEEAIPTDRPLGSDEIARRCARATLARLKRGIPPAMNISSLAIGMERLDNRLSSLLRSDGASRWFAVTGEYGEGKSFFRALACERALAAGFAVASFDVNKDEGALHQPQRHLAVLLNSLQSPLAELQHHEGLLDLFRHWLAVSAADKVAAVLARLRNVSPSLSNTHDTNQVAFLIERGLNAHPSEVLLDDERYAYRKAMATGFVYRRAPGATDWYYFGQEDAWPDLQRRCRVAESNGKTADLEKSPYFFNLLMMLSAVDLVGRSSYARFAAAYRMQLILEWLLATGHKGLLLFVDEVDNVARQIHGKAHPACFRTLAWYCSSQDLPSVRVVFAMTPEMAGQLTKPHRNGYGESLASQQTVLSVETAVYDRWNREADQVALNGWEQCTSLTPEQRVQLFRRIEALHRLAWGSSKSLLDKTVHALAILPAFNTTRRWVRACVQILDLVSQNT